MIARAKQKLRADVDSSGRTHVNRRVPVETHLAFLVIRQRLNVARFKSFAIDAPDVTTLRLGVDIIRIGRIGKDPETIAAVDVLPTVVGDSAGVRRIADP